MRMQLPFISLHYLNTDLGSPKQSRLNEIRELSNISSSSWLIRNELGFYIGRYEDVTAILKDKRWHHGLLRLLTMEMGLDPEIENDRRKVLFSLEGEEHTRLKKHISRALRHNSQSICQSLSKEIIHSVRDKTEIDIISEIIFAYPSSVISSVLGIPKNDWPFMDEISGQLIKYFEGNVSEFSKDSSDAAIRLYVYLKDLFASLRKTPDENNVISEMLKSQEEAGLSDFDLVIIIGSLYGGGVDTTRCQLGLIFDYFLSNPGSYEDFSSRYWAKLAKGADDLLPFLRTMIEEISRLNPTIRGSVRYASEDIEYKNIKFPKGTFLFLGYASANMDKSIREKAELVDFELAEIHHYQDLTFGAGTHKCPGASLAMQQAVSLLQRFIHTFSCVERNGEPTYRESGASVFGPNSLPVRLTKRKESKE